MTRPAELPLAFGAADSGKEMTPERSQSCDAGTPPFQHPYWNGKTEVRAPPPGGQSPGWQARDAWTVAADAGWRSAWARCISRSEYPATPHMVAGWGRWFERCTAQGSLQYWLVSPRRELRRLG